MQDTPRNVKAQRPVAVLQVVPRLQSGGAEQSTCEIAAGLVRAGAHSLVASTGGRLTDRLQREGSVFLPFAADSKNPLRMAANVATLCGIIRSHSVSLIHARSRAPAWSALAAARLCGIPFVTTFHGANRPQNMAKRIYNSVMTRGDVTIANSRYTAARIEQDYGADKRRVAAIYRGVDLDVFDPAAVAQDRLANLRRLWHLDERDRVIFVPARVTPIKGHETVIRALTRLAPANPKLVCIMAGDDQGHRGYSDGLRHLAADLGLTDRVRLVGHCADMPAAYALSEVTLIASVEPEAFGRTAPEAQAMASLVIATDLGGAIETVVTPPEVPEDARTGWRIPPGDPEALAAALGLVLSLPEKRKQLINQAAHKRVQDMFSLDAMILHTLEVYDGLLGSGLARKYTADSPLE